MKRRIKWIVTMLTVLLLTTALLPTTAKAAEIASGTCGENLNWTLTDDGVLTVSGEGRMDDYEDYQPWFDYKLSITSVIIKDGVTSIGCNAFHNCENMFTATIPESVNSIGSSAFAYCESLTGITIPESNTAISDNAFCGCGSLISVKIPDSVVSIGDYAFSGCENLTDVTIGNGVTTIGGGAFSTCESMTNITLPNSVTSIGHCAFTHCYSLTDITIPDGVVSIEEGTFSYCDSLIGVTIGKNVTTIGEYAFNSCLSLSSINIPANVTSIDSNAFYECTGLESIAFEGNAPSFGTQVFYHTTMTAYYPADNATWTADVMQDYGGDITWVPYSDSIAAPVVKGSNVASSGKIRLTWDAVDGASKYQVYRSTSKSGTYKLMKTAEGTSYTNTSAKAGTYYYYYVVAVARDGTLSDKSNIVGRTCDLARPEVTASNIAKTGKIKLSWEKVDGAVEYDVYSATSKDGSYKLLKTVTGTNLTHSSAKAGTTYYYKVKAIAEKSAANSTFSAVESRTCDLKRPTATVELNSKGKPVMEWEKISGADKYKVYIYNISGELVKTSTTTSTKLTHSSAVSGTTYNYRVVAVHSNSAANSAKSVKVSIKSN